jgi:hypothetical protein
MARPHPERQFDPFHDDVMDFAALLEGDPPQRLIGGFRQTLEWAIAGLGQRLATAAFPPRRGLKGSLLGLLSPSGDHPSGSNLTFESPRGFPADSIRASLTYANRNFHHSQAG